MILLQGTNHSQVSADSSLSAKEEKKPRIEFIDLAKGICIILVVFGHCRVYPIDFGTNLSHLRMPLYFFLSGIFFKDYGGVIKTTLRKIDKLLIPFIFFFAVNVVLMVALNVINHKPLPGFADFFENGRITIMSLWFLLCLFWQSVLFTIAYRFTNNIYLIACASAVFSIIGITLSKYGIILPMYLDAALTFSPFFFMGFSFRKTDILVPNKMDKYNIPLAIVLLAAGAAIGYLNGLTVVNYVFNQWEGNIGLHFLQSAIVVIAMIFVCKTVKKLPLISYIGKFSIMILVMHGIYLEFIKHFPYIACYNLSPAVKFAIILILSIMSIEPLRRFFPYVTAQKNLVSSKF